MTDDRWEQLDRTGGAGEAQAKEIIAQGHPPEAAKVILLDFDGTLGGPFGYLFGFPKPYAGASEFTKKLRAAGYNIGIFTSRLSPEWLESANQNEQDHRDYLEEYCKRYEIEYDFATASKIPAMAMIDDKAFRFTGNWNDFINDFTERGWF